MVRALAELRHRDEALLDEVSRAILPRARARGRGSAGLAMVAPGEADELVRGGARAARGARGAAWLRGALLCRGWCYGRAPIVDFNRKMSLKVDPPILSFTDVAQRSRKG